MKSLISNIRFSKYGDYSNIINSFSNLENNAKKIENILSSFSLGGSIDTSFYQVNNLSNENDSIDNNDDMLNLAMESIKIDIEETSKTMSTITNQISENNNRIIQNNEIIENNSNKIQENNNKMKETKKITNYDSNGNPTSSYIVPVYDINALMAENGKLENENNKLSLENNGLKKDIDNLNLLFDELNDASKLKATDQSHLEEIIAGIGKIKGELNSSFMGIDSTTNDIDENTISKIDSSSIDQNDSGITSITASSMEADENNSIFESAFEILATGYVFSRSAASGILKEGENVFVDGATWIGGEVVSSISEFGTEILHFVGLHDLANNLNALNDEYKKSVANWISVDRVGTWNEQFYEGNIIGLLLNDRSYHKYNSEPVKRTQDVTEKATQIGLEIGATVTTGNPAIATVIGTLNNIGSNAEESYQISNNPSIDNETLHIVLNGIEGAVEGYTTGQAFNGVRGIASNIAEEGGLANYLRHFRSDATGIANKIAHNNARQNLNLFGRQLTNSIANIDNAIQVVGSTSNLIDQSILNDEAFRLADFAQDLITEYGSDAIIGYNGGFKTLFNHEPVKNITETIDTILDTGILSNNDDIKRIG